MKKSKNKFITSFEEDVSKWYTDILNRAELIEYGPSKGSVILKPYSFKIWKLIQNILTNDFEKDNIEEIYFPLLIPYSYLEKESKHIEGFAPEVYVINKIGNKEIEPLVIRPTSETLFAEYFKNNLNSYKQLPIKLNQWVNVMRGEKNTRPFLRTSEFLWQEGHTLHISEIEALNYSKQILNLYKNFFNNHLDLFVLTGEKTENEKFAGADNTFTIETILKDGKSLQSATSHYLGQTFVKPFAIKFQNKDQKEDLPFQTSWGLSTRVIGAMIMSHSDDNGLILPWDISPFNFVILTINNSEEILKYSNKIKNFLIELGYRVFLDDSDKGIGFKSSEWEIKGVPFRIEIGPRDLVDNKLTLVNRFNSEKLLLNIDDFNKFYINDIQKQYKKDLFDSSEKLTLNKIKQVNSLEELKNVIENNFVAEVYWKQNSNFEKQLQEQIEGATIRLIKQVEEEGICIHSGQKIKTKAIISKVY